MRTAENKPILCEHLDAISNQLDIENADSNQSLIILDSCRNLIEHENQRDQVLSILMKLRSNKKRQFTGAHFVCAMQIYQLIGDVVGAEATFEEMQKERFKKPP